MNPIFSNRKKKKRKEKKRKERKNPISFIYDMNILNIWSTLVTQIGQARQHIFKKTVVHRVP